MSFQTPVSSLFHAIAVDLEDWNHVCGVPVPHDLSGREQVVAASGRLLRLLDRCQSKATLFILGSVAERHPALIENIARHGHEMVSHGRS